MKEDYIDCMNENCIDSIMPISVGDTVPNIKFQAFKDNEIINMSFDDVKGKWVVLFFYPADFTFVCPTELGEMADYYDKFKKEGAEVISVSTDTPFTHKAWHDTSDTIKKIKFPMAADPTHIISDMFGVLIDDEGVALRGTFLIDPDGVVKVVEINDNSIGRCAKELLRKVCAAKFVSNNPGQVCPASWEEGDDTLKPGVDLVGKI